MFNNVEKYSFSPKSLRREIRKEDFWKYRLRKDQIEKISITTSDLLAGRDFAISNITMIPRPNGKNLFLVKGLEDNLLVRRTNTIVNQFVNHPEYSREEEIRQLSAIISTEPGAIIFRTDIAGFFESINFDMAINDISKLGYNNLPSLKTLRSISAFAKTRNYSGLPRGLSISSTLANFFMKGFDKSIRSIDTCFYYSRYVDDILIVLTKNSQDIEGKVKTLLPRGLVLNGKKTESKIVGQLGSIEYLGYSLLLSDGKDISVSRRKIDKTKTRICLSISAFTKDNDFSLIEKRMRFLACNTKLRKSNREKAVVVGFRYSYPMCSNQNVVTQMKELDDFYHKVLFSRFYAPSRRLRGRLSGSQIKQLARLSFVNGYLKKIRTGLDRNDISKLKQVWKYE